MTSTLAAAVLALTALAPPDGAEAKRRLAATKVTMQVENASVEDVVRTIGSATRLNFVLHPEIPAARPDVRLRVQDVTARTVLKLVLEPRGLRAGWREGAVFIAPLRRTGAPMVVRSYDVRPLQVLAHDFPGPRIELRDEPVLVGVFG